MICVLTIQGSMLGNMCRVLFGVLHHVRSAVPRLAHVGDADSQSLNTTKDQME